MKIRLIVPAALAMMLLPLCALVAAQAANSNARVIEVSGNGQAHAAPDLATLNLAIETRGATAAEAAGRNAALAQKVVDGLKAKLGDKGKVWTGGYNLYPEYREPRGNEKPAIIGYNAANSIAVETGALDLLGPIIDAAISAGANRVNSLDFSLRDDTKARSDAITRASKDAQAQAQALAAALGVKLGPIIKASTVAEVRPIPVMRAQFAATMAASAPTPVQPGELTVPATVSLTYEIQ
jgi:uncharacterized protein YggE